MSWQERMMTAMSKLVSERVGQTVTVARYEDRTVYSGGCESCYYEYAVVDFYDVEGKVVYTYSGTFLEFMDELTR